MLAASLAANPVPASRSLRSAEPKYQVTVSPGAPEPECWTARSARSARPASVTLFRTITTAISALRGLVRGGKYDRTAAGGLITDLIILPVERWHTSSLLPRIWELGENLTPYDAAYVALAEMTGATLLTGDERITAAPATRCEIRSIK